MTMGYTLREAAITRYVRCDAMLLAMTGFYAVFTCIFALCRIYSYKSSLGDSATFAQILWNVAHHGAMLSGTNPPYVMQSWLGFHFSPILLLLAPFYTLWPHFEMLQVTQSLCFGAAGIILFHALQAAGARRNQAYAGCLLFYLNPFILSASIWDFHETAFAVLFMALALWAFYARRFGALVGALLLLMLTKEHYGLSAAAFGLLWGLRYGKWRQGSILMLLGIGVFLLIVFIVMPAFNAGGIHPMLTSGAEHLSRYGWLTKPWPENFHIALTLAFGATDNISGVRYCIQLLFFSLLLPLASPLLIMLGISDLAANLLSANPMPRSVLTYHSAALIPVMVMAAYSGYCTLMRYMPAYKHVVHAAVAAMAMTVLAFDMLYSPFSFWQLHFLPQADDTAVIAHIGSLVDGKPVSAQSNIGVFFANRDELYPFPHATEKTSAVILRLQNPFTDAAQSYFNVQFGEDPPEYRADVRRFLQIPGWHVSYWNAPWLVMEKGVAASDERQMREDIARQTERLAAAPSSP